MICWKGKALRCTGIGKMTRLESWKRVGHSQELRDGFTNHASHFTRIFRVNTLL